MIRLLKKQPFLGILFAALWGIFSGQFTKSLAQTVPEKQVVMTTNQGIRGDVFSPGEPVVLTVTAHRRGYLTVVFATPDHRLYLLYPTPDVKTNRVFPGEAVQIPVNPAAGGLTADFFNTGLITAVIYEKPDELVSAADLDRSSGKALIAHPEKPAEALQKIESTEPNRMSVGMLPVHVIPATGEPGFAVHRDGDWVFKAWVSDTSVKDNGPRPVYFWSSHPGQVNSVEVIGEKFGKRASPMPPGKPEILKPRQGNLVSLYSQEFDQALANEDRGHIFLEAANDAGARCSIRIALGSPATTPTMIASTPAARPSHPPPPTPSNSALIGTILHRQSVRPSSADQVVAWNNRVSITIPGGMLKSPETVTIAEVPPAVIPEDPDGPFASLGRYNIRVGEMAQLPQPLEIALNYDLKKLITGYAPGDQIMAARWDEARQRWQYLPVRINERTNTAIITTDHLTVFEMLLALVVIPAVLDAGHVVYEKIVYDIFHTPNFGILYEKQKIMNSNTVHDDAWKKSGGGGDSGILYLEKRGGPVCHGYHPSVPLYVQDVGAALEAALETYVDRERFPFSHGRGPTGSNMFLPVKVDSDMIQSKSAKGCFESLYDRVHLSTTYADKPLELKAVTAHELFHSIQHFHFNYLKMTQFSAFLWWLEACAEYASARVAWNIEGMGSKADSKGVPWVNPGLLKHPLEATGQTDPNFDELEYDKSNFIEYLVKRGFSFRDLHLAVADFNGLTAPILEPLNLFLLKNGQSLAELYAEFAAWYLLSADSPIGGDEPDPGSIDKTYRFEGPGPGKTTQATHAFNFPGAFASGLAAVTATARPDNTPRRLLLKAETLTGDWSFAAFRLPQNKKPAGAPKATLRFFPRDEPFQIEVEPSETVYLLATQNAAGGGSAKISISESEVTLFIKPADIRDATGKLSWVFEGTATGIPPHVKKLATQWQFGPHYDSEIQPFHKPITDPLTIDVLHQFPGTGSYEISLELFDTTLGQPVSLARAEAKAELDVSTSLLFDPPILVTEAGGAVPLEVRVQNPPPATRFDWDFGDGTPGATTMVPTVAHAFPRPGEFRLRVVLSDPAAPEKPLAAATGRASVHPPKTLGDEPQPQAPGGIKTLRQLQVKNENGDELWIEYDYYTETVKDNKTACIIHGPFRYYSPDGKTEIKTRYHHGYMHGTYHEKINGMVSCTGEFSQGERTGKWTYYHPNGKISYIFHFRDGKMNGLMEKYDESGLKTEDAYFQDDQYIKTNRRWSEYDGKARLIEVREFGEDGYTRITYLPDGREARRNQSKGRLLGSSEPVGLRSIASSIGLTVPPECSLPKIYFNKIEEKRKKNPLAGWY